MKGLRICATGRALPRQIVTNDALSRRVDTSDAWIASRTGIRERRFCCGDETAASLAADAARLALERAGADPGQLCACITATVTPDYASPSVSCLVQQRLGLPEELACFDLSAGCTGFVYALQAARGLLLQDARPYALVIGAEQLSRITDFTDRNTCVLFGDGAGAAVVTLDQVPYACTLGSRGDAAPLWIEGPGPAHPVIHMDGQAVFRFAVEALPRCVRTLLEQSALRGEEIDWFVPHQANARIVSADPQPFVAELDVLAGGRKIHVTYGVRKRDAAQDAGYFVRLCEACGLCLTAHEEADGHFYLRFQKK